MRCHARYLRQFKRLYKKDDGSTAVEFALLAPVWFLMLFLVIEFGRLGFTLAMVNYAAQETTRYAVVRQSSVNNTTLKQYALDQMPYLGLQAAQVGVDIKDTTTCTAQKDVSCVDVTIRYLYTPWLPVKGASFWITASSKGFVFF